MSRTPTPPKTPVPMPEGNEEALARASSASKELATIHTDQEKAVRVVAEGLGYELPADSTSPELIVRDIASNMRRSVEACLEVGKGLCVLKAACAHGDFAARLDAIGMEPRVAQRFMQSAIRFSNAVSTPLLAAAGNQTKLFEMLVLDDEQIEELVLTGQTGELALDDVSGMSVKELRAALREERKERQADADVLKRKAEQIEKLERENQRIAKMKPDEALLAVKKEAASFYNDAQGLIVGQLRQALKALHESGAEVVYMAGLVGQLKADMDRLRQEFDLPDLSNAADQQLADEVSQWAGN